MKKFWINNMKLRSSRRCGNIRLIVIYSAILDVAITDILYLNGNAVLIIKSDDLSSR